MPVADALSIGLVIRSCPYLQRSARSQLDVALVTAVLEQPLRLYFLGDSILQLQNGRALEKSGLPAGYRAWASLPDLTEVSVFAEPSWLHRISGAELKTLLTVVPKTVAAMRADWQGCGKVLVL